MIKIDASSLIYSLKLDWIDSLKKLYEDLVITASIYQEVILKGKKKGKPDAFIGEKLINQKIIQVHQVKEKSQVNLGLGEGESETILNAIESTFGFLSFCLNILAFRMMHFPGSRAR